MDDLAETVVFVNTKERFVSGHAFRRAIVGILK
jgi:hypothetical protein